MRTDESDINDLISPSHTETDQDNYGVYIHSTMWILIEGGDNIHSKHYQPLMDYTHIFS